MRLRRGLGLGILILACQPWSDARAGWSVGVGVGGGGHYRGCGHCWGPGFGGVRVGFGFYAPLYPYYPYYPYYAPAPVVVAPAPVVVQSPSAVQPVNPPPPPPAPSEPLLPPRPVPATPASNDVTPVTAVSSGSAQADIDACLQRLHSPQEKERADALVQLGRLKADRAVGPMIKALNEDASPAVREAAARGLGLAGAPWARAALERAALGDPDREVRHSAAFAAEVLRGNSSR